MEKWENNISQNEPAKKLSVPAMIGLLFSFTISNSYQLNVYMLL